MTATWPDVAEALELAQHGPGAFEHNLLRAVSAMAELLAPDEDDFSSEIRERTEAAMAHEFDADLIGGWQTDRATKKAGDLVLIVDVYREGPGWHGSWLMVRNGGEHVHSAYFDADLTGAEAKAAAAQWLSEHQS